MRLAVAAALLFLSACTTTRATVLHTPTERVTECKQLCTSVGLEMSAMVVIMNSSGCVCEVPRTTPNVSSDASSSAVSGGAVIAAAVEAQRQQQTTVTVNQ
jgi:hypothetical protein